MNEILLSITNRDTGFVSPGLKVVGGFVPGIETDSEYELRNLLGLRESDHEFCLKGVLMAIESYPEVRAAFGEKFRTYDLARLTRQSPTYNNGHIGPDRHGPATVIRVPEEWPTYFNITLKYNRPGIGIIAGGSRQEEVHVRQLSDGALEVEWPAWTGISGKIWASDAFESGFVFSIEHEPASYPYKKTAEELEKSSALRDQLQRHGLTIPFYYAHNEVEKVAVAALALGLSNTSVY